MRRSTALFVCVLFVSATRLCAAEKAAPRFTKKPTVARADGKVKIEGQSVSISPDNCKCA